MVALYTDGAMPLHKVTCVPRGHALGVVSVFCSRTGGRSLTHGCIWIIDVPTPTGRPYFYFFQGIPRRDRRVHGRPGCRRTQWVEFIEMVPRYRGLTAPDKVYGPQNVTSGASSDLRHATSTANAMVKVKSFVHRSLEFGLNGT